MELKKDYTLRLSRRFPRERYKRLLRLTYNEFIKEKKNVGLLLFGIAYLLFYQTRQFSENRKEIATDAIIFSASVTET
ncbi:MAG: hypothetical protein ACFFDT_33180, partial [Candidatus Hodarchaeota archaeon]